MLHDQCDLVGSKLTIYFLHVSNLETNTAFGRRGHSVVSEHLNFGWWYPYVYIQYFHVHACRKQIGDIVILTKISVQLHWVPFSEMPQDVYVDHEV